MSGERYDQIGVEYSSVRRPDPRIAADLRAVIGAAESVVNVGAGTGSYEPADIATIAVEPSGVMLAQRAPSAAPAVQAVAESLPFSDESFEVGLAILTVHHWSDADAGLSELRRVSRRQVVLTWDPLVVAEQFWFARDYLPQASIRERDLVTVDGIAERLGDSAVVKTVLVPPDCTDGFYAAYWARPRAYLDRRVRAGISAIALTDASLVSAAIRRLDEDLQSGEWNARYGDVLGAEALDMGYRIVSAGHEE
ncbi:MAG: methyltransferase domain-containing protein [bacterium]|nr:methyltransferase domain-containing protein [bacterium]